MNIGENIANLRKNQNLTQESLAKLINVSPKTISSYETNRSLPSLDILISISKALNTDLNTILNLQDNSETIKQLYEKDKFHHNIKLILTLSIVFLIPLLFFIYVGYISISSFAALTIAGIGDITKNAHNTFQVFCIFGLEYIYYSLLMFINYILYHKKCLKSLLIINSLIIIFIINFIYTKQYDLFIFIIASIIGLLYAFKLIKQKRNQ